MGEGVNHDTISRDEDCACECHLRDELDRDEPEDFEANEFDGVIEGVICPECHARIGEGDSHDSECPYA